MSANSSIFGTFARSYPITLKLFQSIEAILNKKHEKMGNIYGHLAKIAIWNLKNLENSISKFKKSRKFQKSLIDMKILSA